MSRFSTWLSSPITILVNIFTVGGNNKTLWKNGTGSALKQPLGFQTRRLSDPLNSFSGTRVQSR
ncbi:hypothetical protein ACU8KH_05091 [Lachancea thermotolerans]